MKYRSTFVTTLLLSLSSISTWAQGDNTSFNWKFEEASKLMEEKFFNQAADIWGQLLATDGENANLNYKLGVSYFQSYNQKSKALPYLERAAALRKNNFGSFNTTGYDPFDPRERNAPAEVDYYLGRAYHLNNQFDKADVAYQKFLDESDPKHELRTDAMRGKEQTANARVLQASPKDYLISNVGQVVNWAGPDFSPVLSVDGNALFYTSRRIRPDSSNSAVIDPIAGQPYENVYVSYKDREGNWQKPEVLNINPAVGHLATINVAADGQTLAWCACRTANGARPRTSARSSIRNMTRTAPSFTPMAAPSTSAPRATIPWVVSTSSIPR